VWSESVKALEAIADRAEAMATETERAAEFERETKDFVSSSLARASPFAD
jgi:hypothetical protein